MLVRQPFLSSTVAIQQQCVDIHIVVLRTSVAAPIALPPQSLAARNHCAAEINSILALAKSSSSCAPTITHAGTAKRRCTHLYMTCRQSSFCTAKKPHKLVSCRNARSVRAWMTCTASFIHFACSNPRKPDPLPFFTPNRAIAIPHCCWCAIEYLTFLDNRRRCGCGGNAHE